MTTPTIPPVETLRKALEFKHFPVVQQRIGKTVAANITSAAQCWLHLSDKIGEARLKALMDGESVVVPVEPTFEMVEAAVCESIGDVDAEIFWKAMISAAQDKE